MKNRRRISQIDAGDPRSLLEPLREVQERLRLEVEEDFIKQEEIREAADQKTARFTCVWYHHRNGDPFLDEMDVGSIVERLADEVFENKPVAYAVHSEPRTRDTSQTMVSIRWAEGYTPSKTASSDPEAESVDPYNLDISVGNNTTLSLRTTSGTDFDILKNGEPIETDIDAAATALGSLTMHLLDAVASIDKERGRHDSVEHSHLEFLLGLVPALAQSPLVDDAAREHLVSFFELATNKAFDPYNPKED